MSDSGTTASTTLAPTSSQSLFRLLSFTSQPFLISRPHCNPPDILFLSFPSPVHTANRLPSPFSPSSHVCPSSDWRALALCTSTGLQLRFTSFLSYFFFPFTVHFVACHRCSLSHPLPYQNKKERPHRCVLPFARKEEKNKINHLYFSRCHLLRPANSDSRWH